MISCQRCKRYVPPDEIRRRSLGPGSNIRLCVKCADKQDLQVGAVVASASEKVRTAPRKQEPAFNLRYRFKLANAREKSKWRG